jgi:hypothetical protein
MQPKIFWGTKDWRRLHNEGIYNVHFSPDILLIFSRRMRWVRHVARMGDRRVAYMVLVEKPEERRPLGRRKSRLEGTTKMDL